jgi:cytochrome c nitrite reductase small subunit
MTQSEKKIPIFLLTFVIIAAVLVSVAGVFYVDGSGDPFQSEFDKHHYFDPGSVEVVETKSTVYGSVFAFYLQEGEMEPVAPAAERGVTVGELMRWAGILAIIAALIILILIEFVYKDSVNQMNYRILLIISLFVLPVIVGLSTSTTMLETTKSVQSCGTCHVMDPFVNDLYDPESSTLAARHYKNRWISEYQCYTCHTTYGAHGTFEGKRDGFRHWLLYVTQTWDEPISYSGSYPNMNCTACHGGTTAFMNVDSHRALSSKMLADEVSCTSCHGPAHPTPKEREDVPVPGHVEWSTETSVDIHELAKRLEALNADTE